MVVAGLTAVWREAIDQFMLATFSDIDALRVISDN